MSASTSEKAHVKAGETSAAGPIRRRAVSASGAFGHAPASPASQLNSRLGNQAVLGLLNRETGGASLAAGDHGAPQRKPCGCIDEAPLTLTATPYGGLQARLAIGSVDDPLEHEADRVADQVMRMPSPQLSLSATQPRISRKCSACEEERNKRKLRRKAVAAPSSPMGDTPGSVDATLASAGQPLDAQTRAFMEPRFGADFSDVRVHSDTAAAQSAQEIDAEAYTMGRHIVFGQGRYLPGLGAGRSLLAHELAHVVQQSGGRGERMLRRKPTKGGAAPVKAGKMLFIVVDPDAETITFVTETGSYVYTLLQPTELPQGGYKFSASVTKNDLTLTAPGEVTQSSPFQYAIKEGQPNPASLMRGVKQVDVIVGSHEAKSAGHGTPDAAAGKDDDSQVHFQVQTLSAEAFRAMTGASPDALQEGQLVSGSSLTPSADDNRSSGAGLLPGLGGASILTRFPSYPIPPNATGVMWTQMGFGHFSQFANVGGEMTAGGFRYPMWRNAMPNLGPTLEGAGVPGGYFNDFMFTMMPGQTIVYRQSDPAAANAFAEHLANTEYNMTYRLPPRPGGVAVCGGNCITVPTNEVETALGVKPEILTPEGPVDITGAARPEPGAPFDPNLAGRGSTVREWLGQDDSYFAARGLTRTKVPTYTPLARGGVGFIKVGGVIMLIYGVYRTTKRISETPEAERPRVEMEEAGSWVGGALGSALGTAGVAAIVCAPAGPVDFVCVAGGFVGGLIVGTIGSIGGAIAGGAISDWFDEKAAEAVLNYKKALGDEFPPGSEGAMNEILGDPIPLF